MDPPPKRRDVAEVVEQRAFEDRWRLHRHAKDRMRSAEIIQPEVRQVLERGWWQAEYDEWREEYASWNYAIEGYTVDNRRLRVAIAFDSDDDVIVITVIEPEPRGSQ